MPENYGKPWEGIIAEWLKQNEICFDRIHDQMSGKKGSRNKCDFVAYVYPNKYYIECKECSESDFNMRSNISEYQWMELLKMDAYPGVRSGYAIWMRSDNRAFWVSAFSLNLYYTAGKKSVSSDDLSRIGTELTLSKRITKWHLDTFLDVVEQTI